MYTMKCFKSSTILIFFVGNFKYSLYIRKLLIGTKFVEEKNNETGCDYRLGSSLYSGPGII